jgi:actin related protein 2/3 complex, subunit 5
MGDDAQFTNTINERKQVVAHFLSSKNKAGAFSAACADPPVLSKSQAVKDSNASIVADVINSLTDADITPTLAGLSDETCDVLMKYLYKFMNDGVQTGNYAVLLKLHAALVTKCGIGSIVRVMSDRKTV